MPPGALLHGRRRQHRPARARAGRGSDDERRGPDHRRAGGQPAPQHAPGAADGPGQHRLQPGGARVARPRLRGLRLARRDGRPVDRRDPRPHQRDGDRDAPLRRPVPARAASRRRRADHQRPVDDRRADQRPHHRHAGLPRRPARRVVRQLLPLAGHRRPDPLGRGDRGLRGGAAAADHAAADRRGARRGARGADPRQRPYARRDDGRHLRPGVGQPGGRAGAQRDDGRARPRRARHGRGRDHAPLRGGAPGGAAGAARRQPRGGVPHRRVRRRRPHAAGQGHHRGRRDPRRLRGLLAAVALRHQRGAQLHQRLHLVRGQGGAGTRRTAQRGVVPAGHHHGAARLGAQLRRPGAGRLAPPRRPLPAVAALRGAAPDGRRAAGGQRRRALDDGVARAPTSTRSGRSR